MVSDRCSTIKSLVLIRSTANESINQNNTPVLLPIDAHLEVIANNARTEATRRIAREALLILLLRRASVTTTQSSSTTTPEDIKTYQQALKLIADPILPVRAHGLSLLSELVKSTVYDKALTPGIMDVFMRSVQEEDSYIYLNAVKGLAGMVDHLGKEVFAGLMRGFIDSLGIVGKAQGKESEQRLENALRLGEALSMIVRRSGRAFGVYGMSWRL